LSELEERGLLILDGEYEQVQCITDQKMLDTLKEKKLDVEKTAASCSGIQDPNDVGPTHRNLNP
jgi:hypothetical protein